MCTMTPPKTQCGQKRSLTFRRETLEKAQLRRLGHTEVFDEECGRPPFGAKALEVRIELMQDSADKDYPTDGDGDLQNILKCLKAFTIHHLL